MATGAPLAITILAGSRPHGAVLSLRLLGGALGFSFVGSICQYALLAIRAHREILIINLVALLLNAGHPVPAGGVSWRYRRRPRVTLCEVFVAVTARFMLQRHVPGLHLGVGVYGRIAVTLAVGAGAAVALSSVGVIVSAIVAPMLTAVAALLTGTLPANLIRTLWPRSGET